MVRALDTAPLEAEAGGSPSLRSGPHNETLSHTNEHTHTCTHAQAFSAFTGQILNYIFKGSQVFEDLKHGLQTDI